MFSIESFEDDSTAYLYQPHLELKLKYIFYFSGLEMYYIAIIKIKTKVGGGTKTPMLVKEKIESI